MGDRKLLKDKSKFYKQYIRNGRNEGHYEKLLNMPTNIATKASNSKKNHFDNLAEKLCDPKFNLKAYWSILKAFTNWRKVPIILLLFINGHCVTNFNEKTTILMPFCKSMCFNKQSQ